MRRLWTILLALILLTGCASLPESGDVFRVDKQGGVEEDTIALFSPPGPARDASPEEIVNGFLVAMQANPSSTSTARRFLARVARLNWKPDQATMLYQAKGVDALASSVNVRLVNASLLDSRGGWVGPVTDGTNVFSLALKRERNQWRITNPPNALLLPLSDFTARYEPYNLYFLDPSADMLVPDRVYVPRGTDAPSSLVRSLLGGPSPRLIGVAHSEFDPQTTLGLSVLVGSNGTAQVPLSADVRKLSPQALSRGVAQLAWTLRQIPGITRMSLSVEDETLTLPTGAREISLTQPGRFSPLVPGSNEFFGLRQGRLVSMADQLITPDSGPFGKAGFSISSIGLSIDGAQVAAVGSNGRQVLLAPRARGKSSEVRRVYTGTKVLKPIIDRHGFTWLVDRTPAGARVVLVDARGAAVTSSVQSAPGISGTDVSQCAMSPDGTVLACAVNRSKRSQLPRVAVSEVFRGVDGGVTRVGVARVYPGAVSELRSLTGIAFTSPNDLAVMGLTETGDTRVVLTPTDGSPGSASQVQPDQVIGRALALAVSASSVPGAPAVVRLLTRTRATLELSPSGRWIDTGLEAKFSTLTFVG